MKKLLCLFVLILLSVKGFSPRPTEDQLAEARQSRWEEYLLQQYNKELDLFVQQLGWRESRNRWTVINGIGCIGEFQFHEMTLKRLGFNITADEFKSDSSIFPPDLQRKVLKLLITINKRDLQPYESYLGTTICNITITRAGLLAGMHLGGLGSVKLFLLSDGRLDKSDRNGTKVSDYIREFSIYNL